MKVLESEPVKRLFNQPNIVIKAIPVTITTDMTSNKNINKNGMNINVNNSKIPEISIVPVKLPDERREDANLLPSKMEDKKSEITLLPVKRKLCGHYEPCENIVCDVIVQQYVDKDGVSPVLAVNIEEDEINAPVSKHCKNKYCDALNIDHNRCRRALIKLHRCDKSHMCDICGIILKSWKSRIYHSNCTRKDEYRHNNIDRMHLLRERMRTRELQMLEATKIKKKDYLDPINGYDLTMETLRKNEELIIIPKTVPNQQSIISITSISNTSSIGTNPSNTQSVNVNIQENNINNLFETLSFAASPQQHTIADKVSHLKERKQQSVNHVKFSNSRQGSCIPSTTALTPPVPSQNQYIHLTASPQTKIQSIAINNCIVTPSQVPTITPIQPKPFLTSIRLVPITKLITAPSLLHQTQGIPKFCLMTDNLMTPLTIPNPPPLQPVRSSVADNISTSQKSLKVPIQRRRRSPKLLKKSTKKNFFCVYCSKNISTDWYFKIHVAKHKGKKLFSCNLCDESFSHRYDLKKHMNKEHNQENLACNACDYVCESAACLKNHVKIHEAINPDKVDINSQETRKKIKCKICCEEFSVDEINHHMSIHDVNEENMKNSIHKNIQGMFKCKL